MEAEVLNLPAPTTQTTLRRWAFAKRLCETCNVATAYRDVFDPLEGEPTHDHYTRGNALLKDKDVAQIVRTIATPALVTLGVDKSFVLKRLIENIDVDVTDYIDNATGSFMNLDAMKEKLPLEKRRLVRKVIERFDKDGNLTKRELELHDPHKAMELLARIQQWVQPGALNVNITNETIVGFIQIAREEAEKKKATLIEASKDSAAAGQLSRAANAQLLPALAAPVAATPAAPSKMEGYIAPPIDALP